MKVCFEFDEKELRELMALKPVQRRIFLGGILFTVNITPTGEKE